MNAKLKGVAYRRLDSESEFLPRWNHPHVVDLTKFGVRWLPVVGQTSVRRVAEPADWHAHKNCIEIIYCQTGSCEYECGGKTYQLRPGRIFVTRPDVPHRQCSRPKGFKTYYLHFRKVPGRESRWLFDRLAALPPVFNGGSMPAMRFARLLALAEDGDCWDEVELHMRIRTEATALLLAILDSKTLPIRYELSKPVLQAANRMKECPEQDYPLSDLAKETGESVVGFIRKFKAATGFPPHAYLLSCRIERAKSYLKRGRSIAAVSDMLRFPTTQHFSSTFKRIVGQTPAAWLKGGCA